VRNRERKIVIGMSLTSIGIAIRITGNDFDTEFVQFSD